MAGAPPSTTRCVVPLPRKRERIADYTFGDILAGDALAQSGIRAAHGPVRSDQVSPCRTCAGAARRSPRSPHQQGQPALVAGRARRTVWMC